MLVIDDLVNNNVYVYLSNFRKKYKRELRVLHIGNIANNAYLNAKIMRQYDIEADVLCDNYYHIMGYPEWEDAKIEGDVGNAFEPDFNKVNLNGFVRPHWFAQGPLKWCIKYFIEYHKGNEKNALRLYKKMEQVWRDPKKRVPFLYKIRRIFIRLVKKVLFAKYHFKLLLIAFICSILLVLYLLTTPMIFLKSITGFILICWLFLMLIAFEELQMLYVNMNSFYRNYKIIKRLSNNFQKYFSKIKNEINVFTLTAVWTKYPKFGELLSYYDIVIGYATSGIWPLLFEYPYLTYEHGTIRNLPFEPTLQGNMCALIYRFAENTFITNSDNINAAKKLGLNHYNFIPHPINEVGASENLQSKELREYIAEKLKADFLIFHPSRQHWEAKRHPSWDKGNDIFIKGFARFVKKINPKAGAVFVEWGRTVEATKILLKNLDIEDRVMWIPPQPNLSMVSYIKASDLVADQFYLGAFGGIMPKALLHNCPAMLHFDENVHRWCFPEMPPIINTATSDQVFSGLKKLYIDPVYKADLIGKGQAWYQRYHSNQVVAATFISIIESTIDHRNEN